MSLCILGIVLWRFFLKKVSLTDEQVIDLIKSYKSGNSLKKVGEEFSISKPTVKKILLENNIPIKEPVRLTQEKIDKFIEKYKETGSVRNAKDYAKIGQENAIKLAKEYDEKNPRKCIYCGSDNLIKYNNGGILPCCKNCREIHFEKINKKRVKTVLNKYGVENINQLESTVQKSKETNLEKYGKEHPLQNKEFYEEYKKRRVDELGVDNNFKSEEFKQYMKEYNQIHFGVDHVSQRDDIRKKISITHKEKSENEKKLIEQKRLNTVLDKYNVTHISKYSKSREKAKETFLEKHGGTSTTNSPDLIKKISQNHRKNQWNNFNTRLKAKKLESLFTKEEYVNGLKSKLKYRCTKCNNIIETTIITPEHIWCGCDKQRSQYEDQISDWLTSLGITIELNKPFYYEGTKRLQYEVDIYLPDYNIGIDFHGLYWHSDIFKNRSYHKQKYIYFKNKNINLMQIFENEWVLKEDIVKSIISNKLGLSERIYARNCKIQNIDSNTAKKFLEENHIQGSVNSSINIGIYYKDSLVSVGTFGKYRFDRSNSSWELVRFATKLNLSIIGGFQKLLKFFKNENNPESLISFVDVRYFNGTSLNKSDFSFKEHTPPNYFYFHKNSPFTTFYNRIKFQKHKLCNILNNFDVTLSEYDNMINNGYFRIFDAGNYKFYKKFN